LNELWTTNVHFSYVTGYTSKNVVNNKNSSQPHTGTHNTHMDSRSGTEETRTPLTYFSAHQLRTSMQLSPC